MLSNSHNLSNGRNSQHDPMWLLAKLLDHPHGLELANVVYQLHKDVQADVQPDPQLVCKAMSIVKSKGIYTPRHVKYMTNSDLEDFIAQNS